jgi:hypothetical protein
MPTNILILTAYDLQGRVVRHPIRQPVQPWPLPSPDIVPLLPICETPLPAHFCTCGAYLLLEEDA